MLSLFLLTIWTTHAAVELYRLYATDGIGFCQQITLSNDACAGGVLEQTFIGTNYITGSCASQGFAYSCPNTTPTSEDQACTITGDMTTFSIGMFCQTNPSCATDWCGAPGIAAANVAEYVCTIPSGMTPQTCAAMAPIGADSNSWLYADDGSCATTGTFSQAECTAASATAVYSSRTCQLKYDDLITASAYLGENCSYVHPDAPWMNAGDAFGRLGCCAQDPNTTPQPTASPTAYSLVQGDGGSVQCVQVDVSPSCTAGISELTQLMNLTAQSCTSRNSAYQDVTTLFSDPSSTIPSLYCQDYRGAPQTNIPLSIYMIQASAPQGMWYGIQEAYATAGCTGSPGFTQYLSESQFSFGTCTNMGDHYELNSCNNNTIIERSFSDSQCTQYMADNPITVLTVGNCVYERRVRSYRKYTMSGDCPSSAVTSEPTAAGASYSSGTVWTGGYCIDTNELEFDGATSAQDCYNKCFMLGNNFVATQWDNDKSGTCYCQTSCSTWWNSQGTESWVQSSLTKPATFGTQPFPLGQCIEDGQDSTRYQQGACTNGQLVVSTYTNSACTGTATLTDTITTACSDPAFVNGAIQIRLSAACTNGASSVQITQILCETFPWDASQSNSGTIGLASFMTFLAAWLMI